jgi:hypothetical protein
MKQEVYLKATSLDKEIEKTKLQLAALKTFLEEGFVPVGMYVTFSFVDVKIPLTEDLGEEIARKLFKECENRLAELEAEFESL